VAVYLASLGSDESRHHDDREPGPAGVTADRPDRYGSAAVQQLMGHARATTTIYDRSPAAAKARAASLIHVPYVAVSRTY
jgi:hypothetical protein